MSQIFLFLAVTEEPNKKRAVSEHYMPELLTPEEKALGILVDSIPQPERFPNKRAELFYNTDTQELFYEYFEMEPMPPTPEQIMQNLQNELNTVKEETQQLKLAIAESAEAQQQDKVENQLAIAEVAELIASKEAL
ncbi:hypothetical protein ACIQ6U_17205 [Lysinibacillus fusiformis]|uniref:hypothetical protein n=1 Tax=Lysinibacillus fusiformis TaxID=28031 RepID=UPI00381BB8F6